MEISRKGDDALHFHSDIALSLLTDAELEDKIFSVQCVKSTDFAPTHQQ